MTLKPPTDLDTFTGLDARVDDLEDALELNIRNYSGLNPNVAADSATTINTAIAAASTLATSRGMQRVRLGGFGSAYYALDSRIVLKPHVHLDLGDARIYARQDFASTGMFRAVETQTSSLAVGVATRVNGSKILTAVAQPTNYYPEMVISGTGIAANTKVVAVDVEFSKVSLDTAATSGGTNTITRAATYYGSYDYMKISGGEIDPNVKNVGAIFRLHYMRHFEMIGTRILHNLPSANQNWAVQFGGRDCLVQELEIVGGQAQFADGIHCDHGQHIRILGNHIESGDDMVALGCATGDILDTEADPIRHVRVSGNTGRSNMAFGFKVFVESGHTGRDYEVTDVVADVDSISSVTDRNGFQTNGGIRVQDSNAGAAGVSNIKRITVNVGDLTVGSHLHSGLLLGKMIHIASADDVTIKGTRGIVDLAPTPTTGIDLVRVEKSQDVTIDGLVATMTPDRAGVWATDSPRFTLRNSTIRSVTGNGQNQVRLSDCIDFAILNNDFPDIPAGGSAIKLNEGTTSYGRIRGNSAGNATSNCFLLLHTAAAVTYLDVDDNDTQRTTRAFSSTSEWESTTRPVFPLTQVRRIATGKNKFDANVAATVTMNESGSGAFSGNAPWLGAFYIDPIDFKKGPRAAKLRMELLLAINSTAPACDMSVAMCAISAPTGGVGALTATQGSTVSGSTVTATTPGANSLTRTLADFSFPVAGWYAIVAIIGVGGMAANSSALVRGYLSYVEGSA